MHSQSTTEHRAGSAAMCWSKSSGRAAVAVVVPGHHDGRLRRPAGSTRSAAAASGRGHQRDQVRRAAAAARPPAGSRSWSMSTQSGCESPAGAVEEVVRAGRRRRRRAPGPPRPGCPARVDDRAGEVVRERRRLAAVRARRAQRHRGVGRRRRRSEYSVATARRPVEGVAVGRAVELHRLPDDPGARRRRSCRPAGRRSTSVAAGVGRGRAGRRAACPAATRSGCRRLDPAREHASPARW